MAIKFPGQIQNLSLSEKLKYLKRNPVTVVRQTDCTFRQFWHKIIIGGKDPIDQILNCNKRREFQNRRTEHIHAPIYIINTACLDEDDETKDDELASIY